MKRETAKRKAVLAIRRIVAGAKELAAIEDAMLKPIQNKSGGKSKTQRSDSGGQADEC